MAVCACLLAGDTDSILITSNGAKLSTWPARAEQGVHPCKRNSGVHTRVSVSVQSPHCVQRTSGGSSCPVLHVVGLAGLLAGVRSVCQPERLSRHHVKLTSFKSHSARGPGEALSIKHFPCGRVKKICSS